MLVIWRVVDYGFGGILYKRQRLRSADDNVFGVRFWGNPAEFLNGKSRWCRKGVSELLTLDRAHLESALQRLRPRLRLTVNVFPYECGALKSDLVEEELKNQTTCSKNRAVQV